MSQAVADPVDPAGAEAAARSRADALLKDDTLAQSKGNTPEHIEARQRVAKLFCEIHLPTETPDAIAARLAAIDYTCPVVNINVRGVNLDAPKKKAGFFGLKRQPSMIISTVFPPVKPEDPVYALEFFPVKT
jgi:hypothetical protein